MHEIFFILKKHNDRFNEEESTKKISILREDVSEWPGLGRNETWDQRLCTVSALLAEVPGLVCTRVAQLYSLSKEVQCVQFV